MPLDLEELMAELYGAARRVDLPLVPRADRPLAVPAVRASRPSGPAWRRRGCSRGLARRRQPGRGRGVRVVGVDFDPPRSKKRPRGTGDGLGEADRGGSADQPAVAAAGLADDPVHRAGAHGAADRPSGATCSPYSRPPCANCIRAGPDAHPADEVDHGHRAVVELAASARPGCAASAALVGVGSGPGCAPAPACARAGERTGAPCAARSSSPQPPASTGASRRRQASASHQHAFAISASAWDRRLSYLSRRSSRGRCTSAAH